ncbi:MAG: hypothetical protein IPJ76_03805 [Flavobacteriales bacterium]|nr:MAG: hypothetical protein IPJ76_03805 [Flavobacteriales bacterium]
MDDKLFNVLLVLLPSVVVFLTAFYLIRQFLGGRATEANNLKLAEIKKEDHKNLLPVRLQAYERLTLFLERIKPGPLVLRVHKSNMTSRMLQSELTATVREEFDHNITQQIYVSDRAWQKVRQAKEETIRIINIAYQQTGEDASGTELSQHVFETASRLSHTPSDEALIVLREEVRRMF